MRAHLRFEGSVAAADCYDHYAYGGMLLTGAAIIGYAAPILVRSLYRVACRMAVGLREAYHSTFVGLRLRVSLARPSSDRVQGITYASVHSTKDPRASAEKKKKNTHRDSTTFTYVHTPGQANTRMSLELCTGCVETNRLMRKIAADTGRKFESEPCDLCKERASRLVAFTCNKENIFAAANSPNSPNSKGKHSRT